MAVIEFISTSFGGGNINKIKSYIISGLAFVCFAYCIANQIDVSSAVRMGMDKCITSIIPSVFPSIVLSSVISKSGIIRKLASFLPVDVNAFEVFVLGNIGGYPAGAKIICDKISRGEITQDAGGKMLKYSYNSGPAFCIGIVGNGVFRSSTVGLAIYITEVAVNTTLFIISQFGISKVKRLDTVSHIDSSDIADSVMSSYNAVMTITAYIMLSAVINSAVMNVIQSDKVKYFSSILDITAILNAQNITFSFASLLLCFGGICVIMQISAICAEVVSLKKYATSFIYKLPLCLIYSKIALLILDKVGVAVSTDNIIPSKNDSMVPFICVVFMIMISVSEYKKLPLFKREQ